MDKDKSFRIEQRIRTAFQFIANENLKGVLETQIGSNSWGNGLYQISAGRTPNDTARGSNSAGNGNIMLRKGYIHYKWPDTQENFLGAFQTLTLPAAFGGSAILDDQVGAAVVSTPITDNVKLLAGYARAYDANNFGSTANVDGNGTQGDVAFAAVPVDFSGFNITPFAAFMYAGRQAAGANAGPATTIGFNSFGANASVGARGYWGGAAFTMTALEPFKVMADFNYGKVTYSNYTLPDSTDGGRQGWLFDLAVDYTGLSMMTPECTSCTPPATARMTIRTAACRWMGNPQSWTINNSFFFSDRNLISGNNTNAMAAPTAAAPATAWASGPPASPEGHQAVSTTSATP
jgi:hypothetical protein